MERVNDSVCEKWHELLAMHALGDISAKEETGLLAHVEGCADCRAIAKEMTETVQMLGYVDRGAVESTALIPAALFDSVLGDLHRGGVVLRRRIIRTSLLVGVGAVAASFVLVGVMSAHPSVPAPAPAQRAIALHGASTVKASVVLTGTSWGTTLALKEKGLPGGGVYTVSMETSGRTWWTAGTYRSVAGKAVSATMACAVSLRKISGVRVVNATGNTVLSSYGVSTHGSYQ
jgi:predicted anti-sigma-YlaC factor YlaD